VKPISNEDILIDKRVLSRTVDRSSQIAGHSDWGFDA